MGIELHARSLPCRKRSNSYHHCLVVQPRAAIPSVPCFVPLFVRVEGACLPHEVAGLVRKPSEKSITCYVVNKSMVAILLHLCSHRSHALKKCACQAVGRCSDFQMCVESFGRSTEHRKLTKAAKARGPGLCCFLLLPGFRVWPLPNH